MPEPVHEQTPLETEPPENPFPALVVSSHSSPRTCERTNERILVVDDEEHVRKLLEERLRKRGYDVTAAEGAEEALEMMKDNEFNLVITDIHMKGMDGIELTREMKSRRPDVEVILATAVTDIDAAVAGKRMGAFDYIRKPFDIEELFTSVRSALEHQWVRRERISHKKQLQLKVRERTRLLRQKSDALAHLQEEVAHMDKMSSLGVLAASVAHEVNNPLSAMIGFSEMLTEMEGVPEEAKKYARVILLEGQKIHRLAQQLLNISRQGQGERKPQNLNSIVEEVLSLTDHHLTRFRGVEIKKDLADSDLEATMDRAQIQQVLLNLFLNAAQAMTGGGQLTITTFEEERPESGEGVGFRVSDTGPGVPPEKAKEIFKPFFTTKGQGTGLGLKICKDIVTSHGGVIALEPNRSSGATFCVWLPKQPVMVPDEQEAQATAC